MLLFILDLHGYRQMVAMNLVFRIKQEYDNEYMQIIRSANNKQKII